MAIFIGEETRLVVQGITGRDGSFHARQMREYGTQVVAGVTPGKGGLLFDGEVPIFNGVADAVEETGANTSAIYVPARFAADAIFEAADSGIELVVCITEGIPVFDMMRVMPFLEERGVRLLGPNCPGLIVPGVCKVGILPGQIVTPGRVGVVSRSGTLTYEVIFHLTAAKLGQSTSVGVGGDPIIGTNFVDCLRAFEADPETDAVVMIGEIGGTDEQTAAQYVSDEMGKPVVGFIAGRTAPPGRRMGHAGAIISGSEGTAEEKVRAFREAGITVAERPADLVGALQGGAGGIVSTDQMETRSLGDLLSENRIVIPLEARMLSEALTELARGAVEDGLAEPAELQRELGTLTREDLIPIGSHAVMAHLRTESVNELGIMLGVAPGALPFAPTTASTARALILVVAPVATARPYLQTMAALARALRQREVEDALASARTPADILSLATLAEPVLGAPILVRDVMTPDVISVSPEMSMTSVAELLIRKRLRAIPVVGTEGEVVGMISDADVMEMFLPRIAADETGRFERGSDPGLRPAREVMQRTVLSARDDETLEEVAARMINKDIERFPVVTEGKLVGFLTRGDIIRRLLRGQLRSR